MKRLRFYGHSDDSFGEYGLTDLDYDNCASGKPIRFRLSAEGKSIIITGRYNRNKGTGTWDIGVSVEDENNCPDWYIEIDLEGYSSILKVTVPDGFVLECLENGFKWI